MALTTIQRNILHCIAANRSDTSYIAGGIVLNKDWPRRSDDVDIFHDTDEEIGASAAVDITSLRSAGYTVSVDIEIYGIVEATVSKDHESTIIQWMSETRSRYFPLVRDSEWGARLHMCDLAVNKVIAASSRTKARDFADIAMISKRLCPIGPLVFAAAGKPPHFSPQRAIDEMRRRGLSISDDDYIAVKGISDWGPFAIRDRLITALDSAENYILSAPIEAIGLLSVRNDTPTEVTSMTQSDISFRKATAEPELMPTLPEASSHWPKAK